MDPKRFLLVYGSQTGQAKSIAEIIAEKATKTGLSPDMHCFSESEKGFQFEKEHVIVIVVSTTGEGDPPDTVVKFWRKLRRSSGTPLEHCQYALLGLGDSNYANFCNMGKCLNKKLLELGAKPFHPAGFADDGVGLDLVVEPWINGLWEPLDNILRGSEEKAPNSDQNVELKELLKDTALQDTVASMEPTTNSALPLDQTQPAERASDTSNVGPIVTSCASRGLETSSQPLMSESLSRDLQTKLILQPPSSLSQPQTTTLVPSETHTTLTAPSQPQSMLTVPPQPQALPLAGHDDLVSRLKQSGSEALKSARLSLPSQQVSWLAVEIMAPATSDFPYHLVTYGVKSHASMATIVGSRTLTSSDAVKKTVEMEVRWEPGHILPYESGDAFGFVCPNCQQEVDYLICRLDLLSVADCSFNLSLKPEAKKKTTVLPQHIPPGCTVRQFFTHCGDFRSVPKKALLLTLSKYCSDPNEKRRLEELSSKEGMDEYNALIMEQHLDLLDLLHAFPSCLPPLERMIELLPRLQPRYYSAVSSPLTCPNTIKIAFNVVLLPRRMWSYPDVRLGLCTGWFDRVLNGLGTSSVQVPLVPRLQNTFRVPVDPLTPVVMVGPGTGVAPFVGFLEHWKAQAVKLGPRWLFFGCRHPEKDYIYRQELEGYHAEGTLSHLSVTFSRLEVPGDVKYVHQEMRRKWEELGEWLLERNAMVYVCGDAKNMTKDIKAAVLEVLTKYSVFKGKGQTGEDLFSGLVENGRYHVDAWS